MMLKIDKLLLVALGLSFFLMNTVHGRQLNHEGVQIKGVLKPLHEATLSSEMLSRIDYLKIKEGAYFKRGEVLVRFDCARFKQYITTERQENEELNLNSDQFQELSSFRTVSQVPNRIESSGVKVGWKNASVGMHNCLIRAPWNGRIVNTMVNPYETVKPGEAIIHILDDSVLKIELQVPSFWLTNLKIGMPFRFTVSELGKDFYPRIKSIGAKVDTVNHTVRLTGSLVKSDANLLAGMSGFAQFGDHLPQTAINAAVLYKLLQKQNFLQCNDKSVF